MAATTGMVAASIFQNDAGISWSTDTFKCALFNSSWTPTVTSPLGYSSTNEVSGTGYTAGGKALTGVTITRNGSGFRMQADDVAWTSATLSDVAYAAVYSDTVTTPTADPIVAIFALSAVGENASGTFTVAFPDSPAAGTVIDIPAA